MMKKTKVLLFLMCFILMALSLPARGRKEADANPVLRAVETGDLVTVEGKIRQVGNEPFTEYVLTDASGEDWYLNKEEIAALEEREHQTVKVRAVVTFEVLTLANGDKMEPRRILSEIELIE